MSLSPPLRPLSRPSSLRDTQGALLSAPRGGAKRQGVGLGADVAAAGSISSIDERSIVNPHSLPMYAAAGAKRPYSAIRADAKACPRSTFRFTPVVLSTVSFSRVPAVGLTTRDLR